MLGAMAADLESLYVLGPEDIMRFRDYIAQKYPLKSAADRASILANAIHRIIDKEIQGFYEWLRKPIRKIVLESAINRQVFQVRADDIFLAALRLAVRSKEVLVSLSSWIRSRLGKTVQVTLLQQMAEQVRRGALNHSASLSLIDEAASPGSLVLSGMMTSSLPLHPDPEYNPGVANYLKNLSDLHIPNPFKRIYLHEYLKQAASINWKSLRQYLWHSWSKTVLELTYGVKRRILPVATASVFFLAAGLSVYNLSNHARDTLPTSPASCSQIQNTVPNSRLTTADMQNISTPVWKEFGVPDHSQKKQVNSSAANSIKPGTASSVQPVARPAVATKKASNSTKASPTVQTAKPKGNIASSYKSASFLAYRNIDQNKLKTYLKSKNSILANEPYFSAIISVSRKHNLNPLVLFAIAGQEQSLVPKDSSNANNIANNPYNVFGSWQDYNTSINDSSNIAANTIISLSKGRPANVDPLAWINRKYASDPNWYKGVASFLRDLEKVVN